MEILGDFQGAVGTVGNLLLVFHGFHGPAFSTALRRRSWLGGWEATDHVRAVADRHGAVQVLMDGHRTARQRTPEAALFQLPVLIGHGHRVVLDRKSVV